MTARRISLGGEGNVLYPVLSTGAVLRCAGEHVLQDSLVASQIQKLADRSDVISEAQILQNPNFPGLWPGPHWESLQQLLAAGAVEPHSTRARFYRSQGLTHYRVVNPTNDRFEM